MLTLRFAVGGERRRERREDPQVGRAAERRGRVACLSVGARRTVPVSVSGLPPAFERTSLHVTRPPAISNTDGRTCATVRRPA